MAERVRIVEVGPRDGLQNEPKWVPTATKINLIEQLAACGLRDIEATAFVSPKWVPQMADAAEVLRAVTARSCVHLPVLVPNMRGFEAAMASGAREVAVFAAASESFSRRNINCTIDESLERFKPIFEAAAKNDVRVRGYVSCVVACPYEGAVAPRNVAHVAQALIGLGAYEVSLGDTIGAATPASVARMLDAVLNKVAADKLAGHFHDTYGMAIANVHTAINMGLRSFDSAIAGLGGCPYAPGAGGNVATEDLVYLLHGLGFETGVDLDRLVQLSWFIAGYFGHEPMSKVARARGAALTNEHGLPHH